MKKYLFLIAIFFAGPSYALYIGNPSTPALIYEGVFVSDLIPISLRIGFEGDFLFEKKFTFPNTGYKESHIEGNFYLGELVVNFFERLDLGISAGGSQMGLFSTFEPSNKSEKSDFGYAIQAHGKLIIFNVKFVTLAFDGRYLMAKAKDCSFLDSGDALFRFRQWQASMSLSTKLGFFSPYIGGVFDSSRFRISKEESFSINGIEKENLGVFLGLTFSTNSYFLITLEGHLYSETSFGLNAQLRF